MKKVLVCEDEESIRDFVVINLKRSGYDVVDVACGEDALKAYENEEGGFDVALLDIMMPGIDGMQVCKRFREQSETMGIIMLSAKSPIGVRSTIRWRRSKKNFDPFPYTLSTSSLLPIMARSWIVIFKPRPVPSMFRFLLSSMR